jgi:hypothetical protein
MNREEALINDDPHTLDMDFGRLVTRRTDTPDANGHTHRGQETSGHDHEATSRCTADRMRASEGAKRAEAHETPWLAEDGE